MESKYTKDSEKGFLLITAAITIVVLALLLATGTYLLSSFARTNFDRIISVKSYYIAQSGLNSTISALQTGEKCISINNDMNFQNKLFGSGMYSVSSKYYQNDPGAVLTRKIDNKDTIIPISSINKYSQPGIVQIGNEFIYYNSISENHKGCNSNYCLTDIKRGMFGSIPRLHQQGVYVKQDQCYVNIYAGIPNLQDPIIEKQIKAILVRL